MKNIKYYLIKSIPMILVMVLAASCTIHWPFDYYENRGHFRVVFNVQPDDTEVLLNGRLIGLAYEFASQNSALILASKDNELVLKKRGYMEEEIDLYDYPGREILVQLQMKPMGDYGTKPKPEEKTTYEPKSETVQTPPPEKDTVKAPAAATIVALMVTPAESAIYINGKFWGIAPEDGKIGNLRLAPGKYLIDVAKPGFKAFSREVEIPKQEKFELQIKLEK